MSDELEREIRARAALCVAKPIGEWPSTILTTEDFLAAIQREAIDAYRQSLVAKVEALGGLELNAVAARAPKGAKGIDLDLISRADVLALLEVKL